MKTHEKLLITGATGFIGKFLVEEALKQGYHVTAAVRPSSDTDHLESLGIETENVDLSNPSDIQRVLDDRQIKYIVHNAGLTRSQDISRLEVVNADYLSNVVTAAAAAATKIERLVHISSLAAFGPAEFTKSGCVDENTPPQPVTHYGRSKLKGEQILKNQTKVSYVIIRPTAVFGPGEKDLFTVFKMINSGIQTKVGFRDQKLTFIYVKDLVVFMVNALKNGPANRGYFISDGHYYSGHQLNEAIRKALKKRTLKLSLPVFLIKILAYCSEYFGKITRTFPPLNIDKFQEIKAQSWVCDTSDNHLLGYQPQYAFEEAVKETVEWYKANKWL